jgi:SnoaL-like domain
VRRGTATTVVTVLLSLSALTTLSACGDDSASPETTAAQEPGEATAPRPGGYGAGGAAAGAEEEPDAEPDATADSTTPPALPSRAPDEQQVARAVRAYILGLDARDGDRVCSVFAPGALDEVELPEGGGDCATSLAASIGYRDPRGLPVFEGLELAGVRAIEVDGDTARARATTVTTFADRDQPSVEDDIVYLVRIGDDWRIAKPSAALYRAVGIADVPPSVLAPPPS